MTSTSLLLFPRGNQTLQKTDSSLQLGDLKKTKNTPSKRKINGGKASDNYSFHPPVTDRPVTFVQCQEKH